MGGELTERFAEDGFVRVPHLVDSSITDFLWNLTISKLETGVIFGGDADVPGAAASGMDVTFEGLLEYVRPRIEELSGLKLFPTYSFFRVYMHGNVLKAHRDRPACEVSVSLNLGQVPSEPWPFYIQNEREVFAARLMPGDALLYRGKLTHWRDRYEGARLLQVFLHYVDQNGPHAEHRFDKRKSLMVAP